MSPMRRIACGVALVAACVLASAAEKKFPLADGAHVVLEWRKAWAISTDKQNAPPGTVMFQDADVTKMRGMLVPVSGLPPGSTEQGKLREVTLRMAEELAKQPNAEVSKEPVSFEGKDAHGHYVTGVDNVPKPNEYKFIYSGFVGVGELPFMFNILWNDGGEASAKAMLDSLKGMRVEL